MTLPDEKIYQYLAPPDLWNRRQETGKNVADIFYENGIRLTKAPNRRIPGLICIKEFLKLVPDEFGGNTAKLKIFNNCTNLIRCIAAIQADEKDPSDVADKPHELTHAVDSLRYYCATRVYGAIKPPTDTDRELRLRREIEDFTSGKIFDVYGGGDTWSKQYY